MKSCTTRFTLATWCSPPLNVGFGFGPPGSSPASASICASASPPNPPPVWKRKSRRECVIMVRTCYGERLVIGLQHCQDCHIATHLPGNVELAILAISTPDSGNVKNDASASLLPRHQIRHPPRSGDC